MKPKSIKPTKTFTKTFSEKELQKDQDRLEALRIVAIGTVVLLGILAAFITGVAIQHL